MIKFKNHTYQSNPGETLLECLLRNGQFVPNGCRSGICQSCLMRATKGQPGAGSQNGLKTTQVEKNYFFSCLCQPTEDLEVEFPGEDAYRALTKVISVEPFNQNIIRLRLEQPADFKYRPGQYLTLYNSKGDGRNYSLASLPDQDDYLELHIRYIPGGRVSSWVAKHLRAGDSVTIGESLGDCVYNGNEPERPLLLIGTGSGAAPLYGVLREALKNHHSGQICLYQGSSSIEGLYLHGDLQKLDAKNSNFTYKASISRYKSNYADQNINQGRASDNAIMDYKDLSGWQVYICGNPDMVSSASRSVFLKGASLKDIHADPFVHPKTN